MSVRSLFSLCWGLVFAVLLLGLLMYPVGAVITTGVISFDPLSFYLSVLVAVIGVSAIFFNAADVTNRSKLYLFLSLGFSVLCFCTNNSILFWCFYELSMLPLLYLIFRDSPYSERYVAGWYFLAYLLVTSLPLILVLLYLSSVNMSCVISEWHNEAAPLWAYVILAFVFFTKVPLCPFHTWLPIVHAEATSVVSTFLSGYIMKLGVVGVFRFSSHSLIGDFGNYLILCCIMSVLFLVCAAAELDAKRWLALLSLSHIVVPFIGLFVCGWGLDSIIFFYSLGHGLSAALVFGLLWMFYGSVNTRNWVLLKTGISGMSSLGLVVVSLLSLCSFPPTIQFFSEVFLFSSSFFSIPYVVFWVCYLFFGGLVPLVLCGHSVIRVEASESSSSATCVFGVYLLVLAGWCFAGVVFL
uniref:NADH-ubiquinone oxidoreductase chain 4 n=1 Tax=Parabreviscolex niepini TaxID=2041585 RepID=A0A3G2QVN2_9CEST|nr:NADH dehydrogenase subunit 4 [Parabreviscolex niepini]AYO27337.1 NADH dehydrogenase subunit 4 [Parabreviscolex niepini]